MNFILILVIQIIINTTIAIFFYRYGYKHGWIDKAYFEENNEADYKQKIKHTLNKK